MSLAGADSLASYYAELCCLLLITDAWATVVMGDEVDRQQGWTADQHANVHADNTHLLLADCHALAASFGSRLLLRQCFR